MLPYKRLAVVLGLALLMAGLLSSCQSTPPLATSSAPGIGVGISDDLCPNVVVEAGQQVTWTNQGSQDHIVRDTPFDGNSEFDSGTLQPGDSFAFAFTEARTYAYECSADGTMTGVINVEP